MAGTSPIGRLITDAETRAKKKASQSHTSTEECGCQVTVSWFSDKSRANKIEACSEHTPPKEGRR